MVLSPHIEGWFLARKDMTWTDNADYCTLVNDRRGQSHKSAYYGRKWTCVQFDGGTQAVAWTKHRTSPRFPPRWSNIGLAICLRAHVLTATLISGLFGQWHFGCMCMIWNGQGYRRNPFLTVLNRYTFPGLRPCFICGYHAAVGELYCTLKRRRAVLRTTSKLRCDTLCW